MAGLLAAFRRLKLGPEIVKRFHLMGGECNYLLRVNPADYSLEFVRDEEWQTREMRGWREEEIGATLDEAQVGGRSRSGFWGIGGWGEGWRARVEGGEVY